MHGRISTASSSTFADDAIPLRAIACLGWRRPTRWCYAAFSPATPFCNRLAMEGNQRPNLARRARLATQRLKDEVVAHTTMASMNGKTWKTHGTKEPRNRQNNGMIITSAPTQPGSTSRRAPGRMTFFWVSFSYWSTTAPRIRTPNCLIFSARSRISTSLGWSFKKDSMQANPCSRSKPRTSTVAFCSSTKNRFGISPVLSISSRSCWATSGMCNFASQASQNPMSCSRVILPLPWSFSGLRSSNAIKYVTLACCMNSIPALRISPSPGYNSPLASTHSQPR
mmetsp:Transcript_13813/g.37455  ORF Transcript_13813/g.37455 Transcript_13813/m.37455 type:complete len:282 (+) Transcript_13813:83-928(+)